MWASHAEYLENFRNETMDAEEYDFYLQQQDEIWAENAWLRAAENSMEYCPEWAQ